MKKILFVLVGLLSLVQNSLSFAENDPKWSTYDAKAIQLIQAYEQALFPLLSPFADTYDQTRGSLIFERLAKRETDQGQWVESPLAQVISAFKQFHFIQQPIDDNLVKSVFADTEALLITNSAERIDRQSNLLALRYLRDYLRRFTKPQEVESPEPVEEQEEKAKPEDQKSPPEYPDLPDQYKPHTKDTQKDGDPGSKKDQFKVLEVNFETPFFGQRIFSEVVRGAQYPFRQIDLLNDFSQVENWRDTGKEMLIYPYNKTTLNLFLPPLHDPLQPSDTRASISKTTAGTYLLKLNEPLPVMTIPLKEASQKFVPPDVLEVLKRPVGFNINEWPAKIAQAIFSKFAPSSKLHKATEVAQSVANHIAKEYLYSVNARPETDPVTALNAGSFQCDMAAFTMVGLLRDAYDIPCRIIGGFRAKKHKSGSDKKSYLMMPGDGHVWVEVYDEGEWHIYDPTPIKKDKKDDKKEDGEKDEYSDRELENTPKPDSEDKPDQAGNASGEKKEEDGKDRLNKDTEKREKEAGTSGDKSKSDDNKMDHGDLANMLELGSLELGSSVHINPLRDRAVRVLLKLALDPNLDSKAIMNLLSHTRSIFLSSPEQVRTIYQEAILIHEKTHTKLLPWLIQTTNLLSSRPIATSYLEIYRIKKSLELFGRTLDRNGSIKYPHELIRRLDEVLAEINQLEHPDSKEIAAVSKFYTNLSPILRRLLKEKYNLETVGANPATKEVARLLKEGQLNDLKLLSILGPMTDFILNSKPFPEFESVRTWQKDAKHPSGREILPLQRFSDLARAIYSKPGQSIEEALLSGNLFTLTTRQRVLIPAGHGKEDRERVTILLYDTSGSMSGNRARFQSGLVAAFTARALSDVSPSGKHRHKVVIVPFDDNPGTPVKVTNTLEALDVIHNYQTNLRNTGGGTDIQKALMQAFALIADAEKRAGEPLAAANIILMTDGQSEINKQELAKARNTIDRNTPVQTMFVAIEETNNELMAFARDSKSIGIEQGFYREFTPEHIRDLLAKADQPESSSGMDAGHIYTNQSASALSLKTFQLMDQASILARQFSDELKQLHTYVPVSSYLQELEKIRPRVTRANRHLEKWIQVLRQFGYSNIFKLDRKLFEQVLSEVYPLLETLTKISPTDFSEYEQAELLHLLKYGARLQDN